MYRLSLTSKHLRNFALLLAMTMYSTWVFSSSDNEADVGQVLGATGFDIPDWFKQSFLELGEDAAEADDEGKQLLLFFHLDNCPYCARMLKENFNAEPNQSFIQEHFDCIDINIKGDREVVFNENITLSEKALAEHLKVLHTPTILFADKNNQSVLRIDGYRNTRRFRVALEYVQRQAYKNSTFPEFSSAQLSDSLYTFRDHPAFSKTSNFQIAAQQPLAVIFEDTHCEECSEVHDQLFTRPDVSDVFRQLTVVRVDALSEKAIIDIEGNATTPKAWADQLNMTYRPGVILFDRGKEITRIDNRLYSWHFKAFVKWVAGRHYEKYNNVYTYMAKLREEHLARGEDVSYVD